MKKGRIAKFDDQKGYGFIKPDIGDRDVFFRKDVVQGGTPQPDAEVEYEDDQGSPRGPVARRVVLRSRPPAPARAGGPAAASPIMHPAESRGAPPQGAPFDSFYRGEELRLELFFDAAQQAATAFERAGLTQGQLRQIYQGMLSFARPLQENRITFEAAKARFGAFYAERIVRQANRGVIRGPVKEFFDAYRDLALSSPKEMLGLFRFFTNILCYFAGKA